MNKESGSHKDSTPENTGRTHRVSDDDVAAFCEGRLDPERAEVVRHAIKENEDFGQLHFFYRRCMKEDLNAAGLTQIPEVRDCDNDDE